MIIDNNSPTGIDAHTPSNPIMIGRTKTGITKKTTVRQNDKIADVFPSFKAVNKAEA